jgi:hypothetical protein
MVYINFINDFMLFVNKNYGFKRFFTYEFHTIIRHIDICFISGIIQI